MPRAPAEICTPPPPTRSCRQQQALQRNPARLPNHVLTLNRACARKAGRVTRSASLASLERHIARQGLARDRTARK